MCSPIRFTRPAGRPRRQRLDSEARWKGRREARRAPKRPPSLRGLMRRGAAAVWPACRGSVDAKPAAFGIACTAAGRASCARTSAPGARVYTSGSAPNCFLNAAVILCSLWMASGAAGHARRGEKPRQPSRGRCSNACMAPQRPHLRGHRRARSPCIRGPSPLRTAAIRSLWLVLLVLELFLFQITMYVAVTLARQVCASGVVLVLRRADG
jgi:hypothetical protein